MPFTNDFFMKKPKVLDRIEIWLIRRALNKCFMEDGTLEDSNALEVET